MNGQNRTQAIMICVALSFGGLLSPQRSSSSRMSAAQAAFPHTCVIEYGNWLASPPGALAELAEYCYRVGAG